MYERPLRPDELMHYGVLGMHWGVRRYQPYPKDYKGPGQVVGEARRIQDSIRNDIKANDYAQTGINLLSNENIKQAGFKSDLRRASKDYHNSERNLQKLYEKPISEFNKKNGINEYNSENPKNLEKIDNLFEDFKDPKKYPKIAKAIKERDAFKKKHDELVKKYSQELLGDLGNVYVYGGKHKHMDHKVSDMVEEILSNAAYEANEKVGEKYKNAVTKDLYDLDFLEAIQNESYLSGKKNRNKRLKEYKKFLDDPEMYWKNR